MFIHSSVVGHLGCFCFFTINATVNILEQVFMLTYVFSSLLYTPEIVTAESNNAMFNMWTPRRKIHLMWTSRKDLPAERYSPCSTKGPHFINYRRWVAICWQGLLMYSVHQEEPQTERSTSHTTPHLFMPSELTTVGKAWFRLSKQPETCPA